jgi:chemotaxis protein MotB
VRKKRKQEHENHERWLVSYADFITLLFAFFVVMYALSSVNEGKYRVLSNSLDAAFRGSTRSMQPIQVGDLIQSSADSRSRLEESSMVLDLDYVLDSMEQQQYHEEVKSKIKSIADEMEIAMAPLIEKGVVSVNNNGLWIEVEITNNILFASGSAMLAQEASAVLHKVSKILKQHPNRIQVEGFTDDIPIHNDIFPSNWELSSSRAATVVRLLSQYGVNPSRMVAMGYAEFRPKASNSSVDGRMKNRRVVVTVLPDMEKRNSAIPAGLAEKLYKELSPGVVTSSQAQLNPLLESSPTL